MDQLSYRRHRFPPPIIQHAIWLYFRFTLSYRDVEELLAERGLEVSYETVRRWVLKFGPGIARKLRRCRQRPSDRWHLQEMVVRIAGKRMGIVTLNELSPPSLPSCPPISGQDDRHALRSRSPAARHRPSEHTMTS